MLVSKPIKINQSEINITISDSGFIDNNNTITLQELTILYFIDANIISKDKSQNVDKINHYFNNHDFNFNINILTLDAIKTQIKFLEGVNSSYINNFHESYPQVSELDIINFYLKYISYLCNEINIKNLDASSVLQDKYNLLKKNSELLGLTIKYNSSLINELQTMISEIKNIQ